MIAPKQIYVGMFRFHLLPEGYGNILENVAIAVPADPRNRACSSGLQGGALIPRLPRTPRGGR